MFIDRGILEDNEIYEIILMVVLGIIGFAVCVSIVKNNIVTKALPVPVPKRAEDFCLSSVTKYILITAIIYFFTDDASFVQLIKNPASVLNVTQDAGVVLVLLMIASVLFFHLFFYSAAEKAVGEDKVSDK